MAMRVENPHPKPLSLRERGLKSLRTFFLQYPLQTKDSRDGTRYFTAIHNPIAWEETRYQERHFPAFLRRYAWLVLVFGIAGIALTLRDVLGPTRDLALYFIWVVHVLTGLRAMAAGANTISREHVGNTWETLILTGIGTRRILLGKWLGVMRIVVPWMLMLGVVRLAMLPVFTLSFLNSYAWRFTHNATGYYGITSELAWVSWATIMAVVMAVVLTILEVMMCSALGLAASALTRRSWLALIVAIGIRFTPVVIFGTLTEAEVGLNSPWRVLSFAPLALADGGTAPLHQLVMPLSSWTMTAHTDALSGIGLSVMLLLVLLAGALWFASVSLRWAGALDQS
jgi:hypothetical protein